MTNLDSFFSDRRRATRSRCAMCGAEAPVRVQLVVARVTHGGKPRQGQNVTRSVRLCEAHAVKLLGRIEAAWPI